MNEAAILTIDGVGEWATASICYGNGKDITIHKEQQFPHSLGLLYSAFTYFLGFRVNSGEYKLMGLAPYGEPDSDEVKKFIATIKEHLIHIKEDGSIWLNQEYFDYATGLRMVKDKKWEKLFGMPRRKSESELEARHCNLGLAIQKITEEVVGLMAKEAKRITGSKNLCLAGGVALNCVSNGKLEDSGIFESIFIQPAAGDAGGALGAALVAWHAYYGKERQVTDSLDALQGSYLGPAISQKDIEKVLSKYKAVAQVEPDECLIQQGLRLPDRRQGGWLGARTDGIWAKSLRRKKHFGRPAKPRDAKETESENQIQGVVQALCSGSFGRGCIRIL
jgi:carbamoyltransferase